MADVKIDEKELEKKEFWDWGKDENGNVLGGSSALIDNLKKDYDDGLKDQREKINEKYIDDTVRTKDKDSWNWYNAQWRNDWLDGIDNAINNFNTSGYTNALNSFINDTNKEDDSIQSGINNAVKSLNDKITNGWVKDYNDWFDSLDNWTKFLDNDYYQNILTNTGNFANNWLTNAVISDWLGMGPINEGESGLLKILNNSVKSRSKFVVTNIKNEDKNKFEENYSIINPYIKKMFEAGPDLFSNSFDIFFIVESLDGKKDFIGPSDIKFGETDKNLNALISNYNDLTVRTASISIPQRMQSSYTQKILNLSTEMVSHSVEFENKAELKIDLDSSLSVIDLINSLSGLPDYTKKSSIADSAEENTTEKEKYTFSKNNNDDEPTFGASYHNSSIKRLDIYVNSRSFKNIHHLYWNPNAEGSINNIIYVFYNCKFLGTDSISFSRDSVDVQNKSFPFIFEHLYEVYKMYSDIAPQEGQQLIMDNFKDTKNDVEFITHL